MCVDYFFYVGFWGKVMLKGFLSIFGMRMPFLVGRVDQFGMIAALASLRPRVQIPPRPPQRPPRHFCSIVIVAIVGYFTRRIAREKQWQWDMEDAATNLERNTEDLRG